MDMTNIIYELSNSKAALMAADRTIENLNKRVRRLSGKCMRKNLVIAGLVWFGLTACKMLGESETKCKEAEERARDAEAACAKAEMELWDAKNPEPKDVCCDGKATITKKPE